MHFKHKPGCICHGIEFFMKSNMCLCYNPFSMSGSIYANIPGSFSSGKDVSI